MLCQMYFIIPLVMAELFRFDTASPVGILNWIKRLKAKLTIKDG